MKQQIDKNFIGLMKKYGPGFVALSKTSGKVVAHGNDFKKMWENAEKKRVNFSNITVTHVPKYGSLSLYPSPHLMASRLGIDLKRARVSTAEGIGRFQVKTWIVSLDLIFPKNTVKIRASITNENSTPFLLGRVDLLDVVYSWNFDAKQKQIKFKPLDS